jgi:hypothetical protein
MQCNVEARLHPRPAVRSYSGASGVLVVALTILTTQVACQPTSVSEPPPVSAPTAAYVTASTRLSEHEVLTRLKTLLARRGLGAAVSQGPMIAAPPGAVSPADFDSDSGLESPVGAFQSDAWLVWTEAGRWWVWETGATAPADERAAQAQANASRQAATIGRLVAN